MKRKDKLIQNGLEEREREERVQMTGKLVSICGRYSAGKSSISNILLGDYKPSLTVYNYSAEQLLLSILFGFSLDDNLQEPISGVSRKGASEALLSLFRKTIDSQFQYPNQPSFTLQTSTVTSNGSIEIGFAESLKQVCSIITGIPHPILLGDTPDSRKQREITFTRDYNICGKKSGRQILEYIGTDVFRNQFDNDIWTRIFQRKCDQYLKRGINVIVPDLRFPNELETIERLGGCLVVVFRKADDLTLTDQDKTQHPALWTFLTFFKDAKKLILFPNIGTLSDLGTLTKILFW